MYKRSYFMLAILIAIVTILSGCGGSEQADKPGKTESNTNTSTSTSTPVPQKKDPVELVFYQTASGWTVEKFMETYGTAIEAKFPYVKTKFIPSGNPLPELIAANTDIDILFTSIGNMHATMLANSMQYDISDLIKKNNYDLSRFEPATIDLMKQVANGGMYGLPISTSPFVLVYNKDLFDKFGVPYPKEGMTWDQIYETAKAMTRNEGGTKYRGFVSSFSHWSLTNQLSASYVDPKTDKAMFATDERWKKHLENIVRFYKIPGNEVDAATVDLNKQADFFKKDLTAAMHVQVGYPDKTFAVNWDVVSLPYYNDMPGVGTQPYPVYFNITTISKHKEAAFEVISYMASDEFQTMQSKKGDVTSLRSKAVKSVFGQEAPHLKGKNINAFFPEKMAAPSQLSPYTRFSTAPLLKNINEAVIGKVDINTALRNAADEADKAIQNEKKK